MKQKIHVLDENTANKIAAGEVVDRPASVVKELVENAIDAGSNKIEVEIMSGGISFIRVTDNGCGMSAADAKLAIVRHATSKLVDANDLHTIHTLGFRGEALPTIASVAKFSLLTRMADSDFATEVTVQGGAMPGVEKAGGNIGTTVKVEDLFFNTPARKKFMKTPVAEGSHINEIIIKLAISNPAIAFKFINNNKLVVATPGNGSLFDVLQSIYGKKVSDELLLLDFADEDIVITGFLSKPTVIRSSRQWQTYIVNGRIIGSRSIPKAIDNAYHSLLPKAGYPLAVLNIVVPTQSVDVNVHPQKSEMKFADEGRLFKAVYKTVLDAIHLPEELSEVAAPVLNVESHYTALPFKMPVKPDNDNYQPITMPAALQLRESEHSFAEVQQNMAQQYAATSPGVAKYTASSVALTAPPIPAVDGSLTPLGQIDDCYIVARDPKGLYIIDQHAAHERILYDRFAALTENIPSQQLLVHLFLDLSEAECTLIVDNTALFVTLGFGIEQSGPTSLRLKEIPADIPLSEAEPIIREILESLQNLYQLKPQELRHACLAITACRAAIKAGDTLNIRQMQILLDELANTTLPYTCPHGRPVIIKFSSKELAKMFKRT